MSTKYPIDADQAHGEKGEPGIDQKDSDSMRVVVDEGLAGRYREVDCQLDLENYR